MLAELAVPVVDQVLAVILQQHAFVDIGDISYYLRHPPLMGIWRDSCDVNPACTKDADHRGQRRTVTQGYGGSGRGSESPRQNPRPADCYPKH